MVTSTHHTLRASSSGWWFNIRGITQNRTLFIGNSQNRTLFGYPQDRTLFFTSYKRNTRPRMNQERAAFLRNEAIRRWVFTHELMFLLLHFKLESVPLLRSVQFRPPGTSLIVELKTRSCLRKFIPYRRSTDGNLRYPNYA